MTQMNENAAERLTPARATELARVLDLQAQWENLRRDGNYSTAQLQSLQATFEAYRVRMVAYTARNQSEPLPELSPTQPARLGAWCRTICAVLRRAEGSDCPIHIVTKAYRVADRIAERLNSKLADREPPNDRAAAIRQLGVIIAWCERQAAGLGAAKFEPMGATGIEPVTIRV